MKSKLKLQKGFTII